MEVTCQRCGHTLPESDTKFCPECGLAQLRVSDEAVHFEEHLEAAAATAQSTVAYRQAHSRADWRYALRCCFLVAVIGAVLQAVASYIDVVNALVTLWILMASMTTILLYRRGRPGLPMSAGMGSRMGLTTGMLMAVLIFGVVAIAAFVLRFHSHSHMIDDGMAEWLKQMKEQRSLPPGAEEIWNRPEFRAGIVVAGSFFSICLFTAFTTLTGALAGTLFSSKRRAS